MKNADVLVLGQKLVMPIYHPQSFGSKVPGTGFEFHFYGRWPVS